MSVDFFWFFPFAETGLYERWILTLLHFLWQGTLAGFLVIGMGRVAGTNSSSLRYVGSLFALLSLPIIVALTFANIDVEPRPAERAVSAGHLSARASLTHMESTELAAVPLPVADVSGLELGASADVTTQTSTGGAVAAAGVEETVAVSSGAVGWFAAAARVVLGIHAAGVLFFLLRLLFAVWKGFRMRSGAETEVSDSILESVRRQSKVMGLAVAPAVAHCRDVAVPTVVGIVRPMILLPVSILSGLDSEQLAIVLRHELAHIRRYDLLVNLLQRVIESVLFFHPMVWFISRSVSRERESCCDEMVVRSGCSRMDYVGALLRMAELCLKGERREQLTALAASGSGDTEFERRIHRLLAGEPQPRAGLTATGIVLLLAVILSAATASAVLTSNDPESDPADPMEVNAGAAEGNSDDPEPRDAEVKTDRPSSDPTLLLAQLKQRDALFDNRTLEVEKVWVETISPRGLLNQRIFNDHKFGQRNEKYPDPNDLPDDYEQPHRKVYRLTVRGEETTLEIVKELEPRIRKEYGILENAGFRWSNASGIEQSYSPDTNTLHTTGPARNYGILRMYQRAFECACGAGYGKRLTKIESIETVDEGFRVRGMANLIGQNKTRCEFVIDNDFIVRKASFAIPGRTGGTDEYHFETFGTQIATDGLKIAKRGRYRRILKPEGRRERTDDDYEVVFRRLSSKLSADQYQLATRIVTADDATKVDLTPRRQPAPESDDAGAHGKHKNEGDNPANKKERVEVDVDAENVGEKATAEPRESDGETARITKLSVAVAKINAELRDLPFRVNVAPLSENEVLAAIRALKDKSDVAPNDLAALLQLASTGEFPPNVSLSHFIRYDTGRSMQHGSWVRLFVTHESSGPFTVQVRAKVAFDRPHTQKERMFRRALPPMGMVGIKRVITYFKDDPKFGTTPQQSSDYSKLIADVRRALRKQDPAELEKLFHWEGVSGNDPLRKFVRSELEQIVEHGVATLTYTPRRFAGDLFQWEFHRTWGPNAPVEGYLDFKLADQESVAARPLRLEVGTVDGKPRFICHIVVDDQLPNWLGKKTTGPLSFSGFYLPAVDGKLEQGTVLTAPEEMAPLREANREIWLRSPASRIDQGETAATSPAAQPGSRSHPSDSGGTADSPESNEADGPSAQYRLMKADEAAARPIVRNSADLVLILNAATFVRHGYTSPFCDSVWASIRESLSHHLKLPSPFPTKLHVRLFFDPTRTAPQIRMLRELVSEELSVDGVEIVRVDYEFRDDKRTWNDRLADLTAENQRASEIDSSRYKQSWPLTEEGLVEALRATAGFEVFSPTLSSATWTLGTVGDDEIELFAALLLPQLRRNAAFIHAKKSGQELEFTVTTRERSVDTANQITIALWRLNKTRSGNDGTWPETFRKESEERREVHAKRLERFDWTLPDGSRVLWPENPGRSAVPLPAFAYVADGRMLKVVDLTTGDVLQAFSADNGFRSGERSLVVIRGLVFVACRNKLWVLSQAAATPVALFTMADFEQGNAPRARPAEGPDRLRNAKEAETIAPAVQEFLDRAAAQKRSAFGKPKLYRQDDNGNITVLLLHDVELADGDTKVIAGLTDLVRLDLSGTNVGDQQLATLSQLRNLTELNLMDTRIGDDGVAHIASLPGLKSLDLRRTKVTDSGLVHLEKAGSLQHLGLSGCAITDACADALLKLPSLVSLKLGDTPLTDKAVERLSQLPRLRGLTLNKTKVTPAGLDRLAQHEHFTWIGSPLAVAEEAARRLENEDFTSIHYLESIGLILPSRGQYSDCSVASIPQTDRDKKRERHRFRIEATWISDPGRKAESFYAELAVDRGAIFVTSMGLVQPEERIRKPKSKSASDKSSSGSEEDAHDRNDRSNDNAASGSAHDVSPEGYSSRRVSVDATDTRMSKVLAELARKAGLRLETDPAALLESGLDLSSRVTVSIPDMSLQDALGNVIRWPLYSGVFYQIHGDRLVLTTISARRQAIAAAIPPVLKDWYEQNKVSVEFDDAGRVTTLRAYGVTDDVLAVLPQLPALRTLELSNPEHITDVGLNQLLKLSRLESLMLSGMVQDGRPLADEILKRVVRLKSVRSLDLQESGTSDVGAKLMKQLPQLQELMIYQEGNLKDNGLRSIGKLSSLRKLSLVAHVRVLPFDWMRFTEEGMKHLAGLEKLEHLTIAGQPVPIELLQIAGLKTIDLGRQHINAEHVEQISRLPRLTSLSCVYAGGDAGFKSLRDLRQLQRLVLTCPNLTDEGLDPLSGLTNLQYLNLTMDSLSAAGLSHLKPLNQLATLSLTTSAVNDEMLTLIGGLRSLVQLSLTESGRRDGASLSSLSPAGFRALQNLTRLHTVVLHKACPSSAVEAFGQLSTLRALRLSDTRLDTEQFVRISEAVPEAIVSNNSMTGGTRFAPTAWLNGQPINSQVMVKF